MEKACKNSSGNIFGKIIQNENEIIIQHNSKPELVINDVTIIELINNKKEEGILKLFDEYFLCIGEIAALYDYTYSKTNRILKTLPYTSNNNSGRRNSSYGKKHSEETKKKIGEKSKGRIIPQYKRTPEIKKKISEGLKEYYKTHEVSEETRKKLSEAWTRGCYKNSEMGHGIQGYVHSIKNNKDFYFRSLLELKYCLMLEEDSQIKNYQIEPFQINLGNGHHYTPDFLVNNSQIIELKSKGHLNYADTEERFNLEINKAQEYAKQNNMTFSIIYDTDINFKTSTYKTYLKNNLDIIKKYNIRFKKDMSTWS